MKLLIGTGNKGKFLDIRSAFADLPLELLQLSDVDIAEEPDETGTTFEENAILKARFFFEQSGRIPTLSDDSGILVEALQNELGVYTRRWGAGKDASDAEWIDYFLKRLSTEQNKRASFVCCLCYIDAEGVEHLFEGVCDGVITDTLESEYLPGLPIAACFKPDGADQVYAAMGLEGKNQWSHRGRAMQKFINFLR